MEIATLDVSRRDLIIAGTATAVGGVIAIVLGSDSGLVKPIDRLRERGYGIGSYGVGGYGR